MMPVCPVTVPPQGAAKARTLLGCLNDFRKTILFVEEHSRLKAKAQATHSITAVIYWELLSDQKYSTFSF